MSLEFRSVLIYGMGMMGASLGAALRDADAFDGEVTGVVRSDKSAQFLRDNGLADRVEQCSTAADVARLDVSGFDLIVLGVPVAGVAEILKALATFDGLVTDMSSTRRLVESAAANRSDLRFVGSHPMCGSEDAGPAAFREQLFEGRLCIITPRGSTAEGQSIEERHAAVEDARRVEALWKALGMHTYFLNADTHDELTAHLSHTPHLLSGLLTLWAQRNEAVAASLRHAPIPVTGGGFKDMARIAGSNAEMWTDIVRTNRDFVRSSLETFISEARELLSVLDEDDSERWRAWFREARLARNRLCGYPEDR